jgi:hypothetical protein
MIGIRHKNEGTVVQKNSQDFLVEFLLADNARFFFAFEESETSRITVIEKADQYLTEMGVRNCSPFSIRVTIYGMVTKYNEGNQLQFDLEKEGMNAEDIECE